MDDSLLEHAMSGDLPGLVERLGKIASRIDSRGGAYSIDERLLVEALDYARQGDLDEATHRLRLRARPKYHTRSECEAAYEQAMVETRAARAAAAQVQP